LPGAFPNNTLRVSPDILPPGSVKLTAVWVDDEPYTAFDANALTVRLPETREQVRVHAQITPNR
jgi:hypothetical protein